MDAQDVLALGLAAIAAAVARPDAEHATLIARDVPEDPLDIPLRVWLATGTAPR